MRARDRVTYAHAHVRVLSSLLSDKVSATSRQFSYLGAKNILSLIRTVTVWPFVWFEKWNILYILKYILKSHRGTISCELKLKANMHKFIKKVSLIQIEKPISECHLNTYRSRRLKLRIQKWATDCQNVWVIFNYNNKHKKSIYFLFMVI